MARDERTLTELENCVLGVVWQRGPCTAYTVRREFAISNSSHWSSSAGSIYPVLGRLESLGLIEAEEASWGAGRKKHYRITANGRATLESWIGPPLPDWTGAATFDPIRTRMYFLTALPPARRLRFIEEAEQNTRAELARFQESVHMKATDPHERLASLGIIYELEGRLRWLAAVRTELEG
jgi:DNA-binding PadR family transcriptional regulator